MDLQKYKTGNFLCSDDVKEKHVWAIVGAGMVELDGQEKAQLSLECDKIKKDFTLNMTNIGRLADSFNTYDTDRMVGKKVFLKLVETEFRGKRVDGIRVDDVETRKLNEVRLK